MDITELRDQILALIVPQNAVTDDDTQAILDHRAFLLGLEDDLITTFYDRLFAYEPTAEVFSDGERPMREASLRDWWQRTINGPIDERYLLWMTLVGVIHIRRKVRNPMMVSMASFVADFVYERARAELEDAEVERLRTAFSHFATTVISLISESFTQSYIGALQQLAGLDPKLTARMLDIEVKELEAKGRAALS